MPLKKFCPRGYLKKQIEISGSQLEKSKRAFRDNLMPNTNGLRVNEEFITQVTQKIGGKCD